MISVYGFRSAFRATLAGLSAIWACAAYGQGQLYFTDVFNPDFSTGFIKRMNTDGTGLTTLVNAGGGIRGLSLDLSGGKMYWADVNDLVLRRANLNGSGQEDILHLSGSGEDLPFPSEVAVDAP